MDHCIICNSTQDIKYCNNNPICLNCFKEQQQLNKFYSDKNLNLHPECDEIIPNKLFLGNYDFAKNLENLNKIKVTHILVVGSELDCLFKENFIYLQIDLEDLIESSLLPFVEECCDFIEKSNKIFIHCNAGISRSPSIVIAYLIKKLKYTYEDAFNFVKEKRKSIHPNDKFIKELKTL